MRQPGNFRTRNEAQRHTRPSGRPSSTRENVIAELLALQMKKDIFYIKFVCACCGQEWRMCGESDDVIPPRPQQMTCPNGCAKE
jgi:hypothetical protein